jgi:adenosylhomocysteine nucleosidase
METVVSDPDDKSALAVSSGAIAVDMESAAIARVATEAGLPFVVLRVVADDAADALPDKVESLVTDDGRTRLRGLLNFVLAPAEFARLIRLAQRSQRARKVLQRVAVQLAEAPA